jgi:hypothetical protein
VIVSTATAANVFNIAVMSLPPMFCGNGVRFRRESKVRAGPRMGKTTTVAKYDMLG